MIQNEGLRYRARASGRPRHTEPATIAQSRAAPHNHVYDRFARGKYSCSRVELCHKGAAKEWSLRSTENSSCLGTHFDFLCTSRYVLYQNVLLFSPYLYFCKRRFIEH